MPYQSTKPLATDQLNQSQADIAGNFTALATQLDPTTGLVKFPRMAADAATAATDVGLYAKLSTRTAQTELFFRKQNSGTIVEFTSALSAANGWTRLPSNILLKWGAFQTVGTPYLYTFPVAATIPVFTSIHAVFIMPFADTGGHSYWITAKTVANFTLRFHDGQNVYYLAIGD